MWLCLLEPLTVNIIQASPAGLGRRLGALLYDTLLIMAVWMVTLFIWIAIGDGQAKSGFGVQSILLCEMLGFYVYFLYNQGQTLGMKAWRIKLVDKSGKAASLKQIAIRLAVAPFSFTLLGLGFIWLYSNSLKQTWHDIASHSIVVELPKDKK
ncbi:MAG: RDD family protein [Gammaproteobacteria bacterium]|nr:RDD family protein [Gammaproteobacteria bacterium]